MKLVWKNFVFDFTKRTYVMGILNVTPDSFSDGGLYINRHTACDHAMNMVEQGADIIDIGGESTRPGSNRVTTEEEKTRVVPVIESLSGRIGVPVSVDTYKPEVAAEALEAGASLINDISGLGFSPDMAKVAARYHVPVVLMHPGNSVDRLHNETVYHELMADIISYLKDGIHKAVSAGLPEELIVVDPGIGFGKTYRQDLEIINKLHLLCTLERPILIGVSRKAFIGDITGGLPASERLEGTAAATSVCVMHGANIVRVHDVR
ncbi:MAG TPA: dihydropteroate synthase, partial [Thermodesulfovibrionia bacterium]|nr:dihydropteroate synthase [Thermodesulfovibrionia bacterium]